MAAHVEQLEFQAEARQLLDLMIHSVYSNKDSFLRELISNASDALDKLRLEAFRNKDLAVDTSDLHIELITDTDARTLTVRDNGIGVSDTDRSGSGRHNIATRAAKLGGAARIVNNTRGPGAVVEWTVPLTPR